MYFDADLSQAWSCTVWLRWLLQGNDGSDRISFDTLCIGLTWAKDINRLYKAHRILQVSVKFDQSSVRASNKKNFHKIWLQLGRWYDTTERVLFLLPLYDLSNAILLFTWQFIFIWVSSSWTRLLFLWDENNTCFHHLRRPVVLNVL